jgi:hypothetical protein
MNNAYLIHSRPYNEKKQFQVLFTRENGMTSIAVGSKTVHHPFTKYIITSLPQKKTKRITHANSAPLIFSGKKLYCGLYLNELLYLFCKENADYPQLFDQYEITLSALNQAARIDPVLRQFELALIEEAGYAFYPDNVTKPYVTFCTQEGLIGHTAMVKDAISTQDLAKMRYAQFSSTAGKKFIKSILNQLLTRQTQSKFFYDSVLAH